MGQIVRRKKKGRPSKTDLERRNSTSSEPASGDKEPRRSLRRRNVRYTFDFDDYLDEGDYYEDDEDVRKRDKKLRKLLKLQGSSGTSKGDDSGSTRRVDHDAPSPSPSSSQSDDDDKPSSNKKRRVGSDDEIDGDDDEENEIEEEIEEARERKAEVSGADSDPGSPAAAELPATELPMPDKKTIELILDKLQKKDIYGVYAEPVDPDELPDYHEVIKNPMDFATIRRKLGNGRYSRLEQLESDVFLLCSNAMQYNAPDTVYHKQASSIQELARRKFQRLRDNVEQEAELKSEHKTTSNSIFPRKQAKKPFGRSVQEPVGSDFSSGATLATTGELQNGLTAARTASCERPRGADDNSLFTDNNADKGEESLPGKGFLSRLGRKPSIHDENRRATYNVSDEPVPASESIFSTFEGEAKQLVPVGLQADHSYARSLARFAATLGSVAWKVASERIEQALPAGTKFGRGWVGEYEPLPTPVLILENCTFKEPIFPSRSQVMRENKETSRDSVPVKEPEIVSTLEGKPLLFATSTSRAGTWFPAKEESPRGPSLDVRGPFFCSPGAKPSEFVSPNYRQQHLPSRNSVEPERRGSSTLSRNSVEPERRGSLTPSRNSVEPDRKSSSTASRNSVEPERRSSSIPSRNSVEPERRSSSIPSRNSVEPERKSSTQVELNYTPSANKNTADFMRERQIPNGSDLPASRSAETIQGSRNLMPSASFKQPSSMGAFVGELHNGKPAGLYSNGMVTSSSNNYPNQMTQAGKYFPQQQQEQGLSDPVQLMKMLAEKNQNQHKPPNNSAVEIQQVVSVPHAGSPRREESNNAAVTAARAWMSLGAGGFKSSTENNGPQKVQISTDSLYNGTHDRQPQVSRFRGEFPTAGMQFQPDKNNFPVHAFVQQPVRMVNEPQFQNRPMGFPQLVTADLSRFQMQSPWKGVNPQMQQRQKQESLPPDLNIGFQSVGSPGRQSSGVLVDSQQPDLALQL